MHATTTAPASRCRPIAGRKAAPAPARRPASPQGPRRADRTRRGSAARAGPARRRKRRRRPRPRRGRPRPCAAMRSRLPSASGKALPGRTRAGTPRSAARRRRTPPGVNSARFSRARSTAPSSASEPRTHSGAGSPSSAAANSADPPPHSGSQSARASARPRRPGRRAPAPAGRENWAAPRPRAARGRGRSPCSPGPDRRDSSRFSLLQPIGPRARKSPGGAPPKGGSAVRNARPA